MLCANARFRGQRITGVQRYASEILDRLGKAEIREIRSTGPSGGPLAHLWEQISLPLAAGDDLLWNPCATGPLLARKFVVTIFDLTFLDHPEWFSRAFRSWYGFLIPRLIRRATTVIAISHFTKSRIESHVSLPPDRLVVIPLAASEPQQPLRADAAREFEERHHLAGRRFLLSVCSLEPRKNLVRLLEAWSRIQTELPADMFLVVTGAKGGSRVFAAHQMERIPDRVVFTDYVDDRELGHLYRRAHAFVYPSLYEGFGLPPLEAMSHGCPVLTSNTTSIPEVTGDAALYFDPTDTDAISAALLQAASNPEWRDLHGQRALERARQFSWDSTATRTLEVLQAAEKELR